MSLTTSRVVTLHPDVSQQAGVVDTVLRLSSHVIGLTPPPPPHDDRSIDRTGALLMIPCVTSITRL